MSASTRTTTTLGVSLAAAMLVLSACGGEEESGSSGSPEATPSQEESTDSGQGPQPDLEGIPEVVAEVNGEEVTRDEFVATYEARFQEAAAQVQMGGEPPDDEALKEQTAEGLVDTELMRQEAESRGISASDEDVDAKLTELAQQNQLGSSQELLDALEKQGTSADEARAQVETQLLVEGLVSDEAGNLKPTEKDLRTLYQQAKQQQAQAGKQGGQQPIPPFAKVKPQLEEQALAQEQGQVAQELLGELRQDAEITINL